MGTLVFTTSGDDPFYLSEEIEEIETKIRNALRLGDPVITVTAENNDAKVVLFVQHIVAYQ